MKQKIRFIINPISGVKKKNNIPDLIKEYLDHSKFDYDISFTEYRKHAKSLAYQSSLEGFDIVCAVGGDGSVHEVGTALIGTPTKLAILPAGSGNGLARHLHISLDIAKAIQCINENKSIKMDTVIVNDKPFLGVGGYGFDALIAKKFSEYHTRGFMSYIKLVMKEYFKFSPKTININMNGKIRNESVVLCTIANASEFGNGFVVSPNSDVTDGKIELCILKPFSIWSAPSIAYRFFKRTADKSRFSEIISFEKARIRLTDKIAHYDGEPFDVREELNVQVVPKSLNILVG
ncbi:MAG: diacylglycerol kinase family lipid kinase [Flavobacteriia bacterium]|nr:diacylglycerol kinase family lipid kinase [Flavobacteriia bacterium]